MKKLLTIFGIVIAVLIAAAVLLYFFGPTDPEDGTPVVDVTELFPFGETRPRVDIETDPFVTPEPDTVPDDVGEITDAPRLRKITSYPVSGYTTYTKTLVEENLETGEVSEIEATTIRYGRTSDGFIFDATLLPEITYEQKSSTQIPRAYDLYFGNAGMDMLYRIYNEEDAVIDSFGGSFPIAATIGDPIQQCPEVLPGAPLDQGDRGDAVVVLQNYLNDMHSETLETDGVFGGGTRDAVTRLQDELGVSASGTFDEVTSAAVLTLCESREAREKARLASLAEITNKGPENLRGSFLVEDIIDVTIHPEGEEIFYLIKAPSGSVGFIANPDGTNETQVFTSPFSEWLSQYVNESSIFLTTKASAYAVGFVYRFDPLSQTLEKIWGDLASFTTNVSPNGDRMIYSALQNSELTTGVFLINSRTILELDMVTLPEKCVWSESNTIAYCAVPTNIPPGTILPDDWYQGDVAFTDRIVLVNVDDNRITSLVNLQAESGERIDVERPMLSRDGRYLIFRNRIDGSLWSLEVN